MDLIITSDEIGVNTSTNLDIYKVSNFVITGFRKGKLLTPQASWYSLGTALRKFWPWTQVQTLVPWGEDKSNALTVA